MAAPLIASATNGIAAAAPPVAVSSSTASAPTSTASLGSCPHLTSFLAAHPQPPAIPASLPPPLTIPDGADEDGTVAVAALPPPAQPATQLHALLQLAATLREEQLYLARSSNCSDESNRARVLRLTSHLPHCSAINCQAAGRPLLACIECVNVGCWAPRGALHRMAPHSRQHAQDEEHPIGSLHMRQRRATSGVKHRATAHLPLLCVFCVSALDLSRLQLYCFSCCDYVYHPTTEQLIHSISPTQYNKTRRTKQTQPHSLFRSFSAPFQRTTARIESAAGLR